ncbi:MAG: zinc ABC transporter substrate-binding protein [Verrucomicrobia bacterium]|nr:zinc ABC transporter substrate-binding protein [Verrucomicrobiota bacterium]MBS0645248.1 zinc ABC transporter substrate-binding protein [Verrucomicrobiota bacterium]
MENKIMRHIFILCLMALCLAGCKQRTNQQWNEANGKVKVLTTLAMISDMVKEIGAEHVDVETLIRGELDPHSYELVKGDDEKFIHAQLVFYNGLGLEHSLSLRQKLEEHQNSYSVTEAILNEEPCLLLHFENQYDPHVWMDITLWMRTIKTIAQRLCEVDPAHAEFYQTRSRELYNRLENADREIYQIMQSIPADRRFLITSHDAFHYFTRRYLAMPNELQWRERCAAPEGLAPDAQLSITDIYDILNLIEKHRVKVLFPESNVSKDALKKIMRAAQERGCPISLSTRPLYGDTMGEAENYLEMVFHNAEVISEEIMQSYEDNANSLIKSPSSEQDIGMENEG